MTVDVEVHTTINRSRSDVAGYCCDPDNVTAWYANIRTCLLYTSDAADE